MKAIIHIGAEKTGTTTIQHFLHRNRDLLATHGMFYPRTPGLVNHRALAVYAKNEFKHEDAFILENNLSAPEKLQLWKANFQARLQTELRQLDAGVRSVIFSSEHLHSRLSGEDGIRNLRALLSPWFEEIEILVYLRRQDRLAVSAYSMKLKVGMTPTEVLNLNVDPENHYYNYYIFLNKWRSVFGRQHINVILFEPATFLDNDLISSFLASAGIPDNEQWARPQKLNEKLSWQGQHLLRRYNERYPGYDGNGRNLLNIRVRQRLLARLEARYPGPSELPTRSQAISFYDIFREANDQLAREWFGREHLFEESFSEYPEHKIKHRLSPVDILYSEMAVKLERYKLSRRTPID